MTIGYTPLITLNKMGRIFYYLYNKVISIINIYLFTLNMR